MEALNRHEILAIIEAAQTVVCLAIPMAEDLRTGAYLCVADRTNGNVLLTTIIGKVADEKAGRYLELSQEKVLRLAARTSDHLSWQSRNPDEDRWGGAIRGRDMIFSLSGLSPDTLDEAAMLYLAVVLGQLTQDEAIALSMISGSNNYYPLES